MPNFRDILAILIISCSFSTSIFSQYLFIENKNQWHENVLYKMPFNDGAMFLEENCITFNFMDRKEHDHSMAHHGVEDSEDAIIKHYHAYKVHFKNANKGIDLKPEEQESDYCNYFIGNDPAKHASYVRKFQKVRYYNIYNNIDLLFRGGLHGVKYDFRVLPGGDPTQIKLVYEGVESLEIINGDLVIYTSVNEVVELAPVVYQIIDGDSINIACNYRLKNKELSFEILEPYSYENELIIDPSLVFSTYTGSTGDNWGFTATWDYNDNVYSGGIVFEVGYPTNTGAFQVNFAGGAPPIPENPSYYGNGCDVGIIKYNEDGTQRLFATYIGGSDGEEMPHSLVVNENNELLIMGTTGSSDFPTTSNAYDQTFNGGEFVIYDNVIAFPNGTDIYVLKLSEDGSQLLAGTYIGGSANDGFNFKHYYGQVNPDYNINWVMMHGNDSLYYNYADGARGEIVVDNKGYVYVGTNTFSSDFPEGMNQGFQQNSGGQQDGIVFKLNKDLSQMLWSTYLGGSEDDAIYSIDLGPTYDVYVAGGTVSSDFPTTPNAYNTNFNGGTTDGFVAHINQDGNNLIACSYFGSDQYDQAYFVRTDDQNNVFICGQTEASGSTLIYNAAYNNPNSGQFIAKFLPELSELEWSTVFGTGSGEPNISITAFAVDICNRIYLSGWGRFWPGSYYNSNMDYYTWSDTFGTKGMDITSDAIQTETDGQDFYIMVLDENASNLEYATFFGEVNYPGCGYSGHDHVDGGTSRFDKKGHIIQSVCASCGGCQQFPTSPGVWSNTNGDGINYNNCNNAVFKIRIIDNLAAANFDPIPAGCSPYTVNFNNNSQGTVFTWYFGDGTTSNEYNPTHTYTEGGTYEVMLIVEDPAACNLADTMIREIQIMNSGVSTLPDLEACPGQNVVIGPDGEYDENTTFNWLVSNGLNSSVIQNPTASPLQTTTYTLLVEGLCTDTIHQTLYILEPEVDVSVSNDTLICEGGTAILSASTNSDENTLAWSSSPNFNPLISNQNTISVSPQNTTTYYVRATEPLCFTDDLAQVTVNVHQFNYNISPDKIICQGDQTNLNISNQNNQDVLNYSWSPPSSIISGQNSNNVVVNPTQATTFTVTLTNQIGCVTTDEVFVDIDDLQIGPASITDMLCYGDCTATLDITADGIPPYQFSWDNGNSGNTGENLCAGEYQITVTDNLGCTATENYMINQPVLLEAQFNSVVQPECDGIGYGSATVLAQGGTPPYNYNWQYGGSNQTNNQLLTGINAVSVTDANGCDTIIEVDMLPPGDIAAEITNLTGTTCYGDCDGSISVNATSGTAPFNYNWSNGEQGSLITELCSGPYTVTIIDSENCVIHKYVYLVEPEELIANPIESGNILCYGETTDITVNTQGGTMPYNVSWSTGAEESTLTNVPAGVYEVTVTDANLCIDSATIQVNQPPILLMDTSMRNMLCTGLCSGEAKVFPDGGTPPYSYNWSNGDNNSIAESLCEGTYVLTLTDNNGCSLTENFFIINENYIPPLEAYPDRESIYYGETTTLHAIPYDSTTTYHWRPPNYLNSTSQANVISSPEEDIEYIVTITDKYGCSNIDTVRVKIMEIVCGDPYIYIPNAFSPNGDGNNDYFIPLAPQSLITDMYFAVFNRWGELIYETDNINDQGWDGTYKGEVLAPDVFVFYFKATCLNQLQYEKKGNVTLIR
jgi:gliding motility-associated-like protein